MYLKYLLIALFLLSCSPEQTVPIADASSDCNEDVCSSFNIIPVSIPDASVSEVNASVCKPCPDDMVYIKRDGMRFCIDIYEWPNIKGELPDYAMSAYDAENSCKSVGKRLCTHKEWVFACKGKNNLAFGYSDVWKKDVCNDSMTSGYIPVDWSIMNKGYAVWKNYAKTLYKGAPSGYYENCYSEWDDGARIFDLVGNLREWKVDPQGLDGYSFGTTFWFGSLEGAAVSCDFTVRSHSNGFRTYEASVRCCRDAK